MINLRHEQCTTSTQNYLEQLSWGYLCKIIDNLSSFKHFYSHKTQIKIKIIFNFQITINLLKNFKMLQCLDNANVSYHDKNFRSLSEKLNYI